MGTQLLNGDCFIEGKKSNEEQVLINETAVRLLNLSKPIGVRLKLMGQEYAVIGVVEDVQYRTLHEPALPVLYSSNFNTYSKIALKLNPGNHIESIKQIKAIWRAKYPNEAIRINFFDSKLESNYETEINQLYMFNILVFVGGFITVLGLMGLVSFIIEQKNKEIGIRKVSGAKTYEIIRMLNKDFLKWVVIAFLIACPIAYYAMSKWLSNFAYKTELSWWIFALAGLIAMGIALLTVSFQSWRAATRNPVESLRYE
jgi:putative ABC transport system permease protein